jgi:hypothetical protein
MLVVAVIQAEVSVLEDKSGGQSFKSEDAGAGR